MNLLENFYSPRFSSKWLLTMSSAMDKAMMAMSLDEVDTPFDMPELPEFSSCERNVLSLIGRSLNPECQPMKHLIRNMPRKWQKLGRVRGVALSHEKFQFIFNSEHDLQEVLDKGVHTFNEWALAVDRWCEFPPDNYLQFIPIWVQIWRLPVNYYTVQAITALGEQIGQVLEVAFDPVNVQIQEFVRVKVLFDVSRPLRRSKVVNYKGGSTKVHFEYERVQKRCYECQRMTHEKDFCPILVKQRQEIATARRMGRTFEQVKLLPVLKESDPLFGVLVENQVGIDPATGRPRIAPVVLEGMRQYLRVSSEEEKLLRIEKVKSSVREVEQDPLAQKSILRLEPLPIVHHDLNKGKGLVFNYQPPLSLQQVPELPTREPKLMQSAIGSGADRLWLVEPQSSYPLGDPENFLALSQPFQDSSTVHRTGFFEAGSSGTITKKVKIRKRPTKNARKQKPTKVAMDIIQVQLEGGKDKRKAVDVGPSTVKSSKLNPREVIPNEGLPNAQ